MRLLRVAAGRIRMNSDREQDGWIGRVQLVLVELQIFWNKAGGRP